MQEEREKITVTVAENSKSNLKKFFIVLLQEREK